MKFHLDPKKLGSINFYGWGINIDYEYSHNCTPETCNLWVCRCGTISNTHISSIDIPLMIRLVTTAKERNNQLYMYALDRLFNLYISAEELHVKVEPGYYGQELTGVFLDNPTELAGLINNVQQLVAKNAQTDLINFLLQVEYGYILSGLDNVAYSIQVIDKDHINYGRNYEFKINSKFVQRYKTSPTKNIPQCIVLPLNNGRYRLIDGRHRVKAYQKSKILAWVAHEHSTYLLDE